MQIGKHEFSGCLEQTCHRSMRAQNPEKRGLRFTQHAADRTEFIEQFVRKSDGFVRCNNRYELRQDISVPMLFSLFWW